jgi:glycosyltransferase involved in cell wall biosynthesis/uncharacterized coiled-coil protein SlyX
VATDTPIQTVKLASRADDQASRMPIVFYSFNDEDALAVLRMLGPAKQAGLELIHGVHNRVVDVEAVNQAEIVILQREFSVDYNNYEKVIDLARSMKKPVILDIDDLIIALPQDHPDRLAGNFSPALLPLLQSIIEADLITVPTEHLRENLLPYNPSIEVIPNYLDDSLWQLKPPQIKNDPATPVIIGYMGGHSHSPDLQLIQPALVALVQKYQDRIHFKFMGIEPPVELAPFTTVDWFPPNSSRYDDFAVYFQQQEIDIAIAPLCDNLFNSCKSAIKFFEYSAIGVPGVYSRVAPYADMIENEKHGLLAATTEEWVEALSMLIESPELRSNLVQTAQQKIKQSWLLSKNLKKRINVYTSLQLNYHSGTKISPFFFEMEKSITRQLYEQHLRNYIEEQNLKNQLVEKDDTIQYLNNRLSNQDRMIRSLSDQISDQDSMIQSLSSQVSAQDGLIQKQNQTITDLEAEVMSYVTSRSWKLTRPLRRILKKW